MRAILIFSFCYLVVCVSFSEYLFEKNKDLADKILLHPFLQGMKTGKLDMNKFKYYLAQDAIYLDAYARAYLVAAAKTNNNTDYNILYQLAGGALDEVRNETKIKPNEVTKKYMNLFTATAWRENVELTCVVLCPCMRLYAYLGRELANKFVTTIPPEYKQWISYYNSTEFHERTGQLESIIDKYIVPSTPLAEKAMDLYTLAMQYEFEFFDICYQL